MLLGESFCREPADKVLLWFPHEGFKGRVDAEIATLDILVEQRGGHGPHERLNEVQLALVQGFGPLAPRHIQGKKYR